jgi:hypothetical protein
MQLGLPGGGRALENLFDLVNPPAGTVELITQKLVGWAGREAKPAMYTGAQNLIRLGSGGSFPESWLKSRFHLLTCPAATGPD